MRKCDLAQRLKTRSLAKPPHRAGEIAETVHGENGSPLVRRDKTRAGEVRAMMLDPVILRAHTGGGQIECCGDLLLDAREFTHHADAVEREARHVHRKPKLRPDACRRIAWHGDVI